MAAPNIASHWIQVHGGTGDFMNQRVTDGADVLLDTTLEGKVGGVTPGVDSILTKDF